MTYTYEEMIKILGNYFKVREAIDKGDYFKVSYGIYSDKSPNLSELEGLFLRYPNAVLTLESAFATYEMSDYIPNKYILATSQKAHRIENTKVKQIYMTKEILNIGKETIKTKYGSINIYDKERMLIELFRLKSKLSYPYFKEIINSYRELYKNEKIDSSKIAYYCSLFKNGESLRKRIEEVII